MLEGSAASGPLEEAIRGSRTVNADGTKTIYNLAYGMDLSKPRATAEAIAKVRWHEDVEG